MLLWKSPNEGLLAASTWGSMFSSSEPKDLTAASFSRAFIVVIVFFMRVLYGARRQASKNESSGLKYVNEKGLDDCNDHILSTVLLSVGFV